MSQWFLRCMHGTAGGRELRGNMASVHLDHFPALPAAHTQVLLQRRDRDCRVAARDSRAAPIRFCGHGALAAARVALAQSAQPSARLIFSSAAQQWTGWLTSDAAADRVTLSFARPTVSASAVPRAAAQWFGVVPQAAATSGAADDYLILEVATCESVQRAQPDAAAISAATRRAVILTALAPTGPVFRYFAPQYGDAEDAATGSAAVQLGAYWHARAGLEAADYLQLSVAGGCMTVRCHTAAVELSARVEYLSAP